MDRQTLKVILAEHVKWLNGEGGTQANLRYADLRYANLSSANLSSADLRYANLRYANLSSANLSSADLRYANLRSANLSSANLSSANLSSADLSSADLRSADLRSAKNLAFQIPQEGELIVWKAVLGGVAKLRIPPEAKRTGCLKNRKCRAEWVETLEIIVKGKSVQSVVNRCDGDAVFAVYAVGEVTKSDSYDDDIRLDCTHGVHFFLSREEAEAW